MNELKIGYLAISNIQSSLAIIKKTINELGCKVSLVRLDEKIVYTKKSDYHIIILEPVISNWEWLDILLYSRHWNPSVPVILFSLDAALNKGFSPLASDTSVFLVNDTKMLKENFHLIMENLNLPKNHILFVDDDVNILNSYHRSMRKTSWHITTASSAEKALKILSSERVDMIVTDIKMPEMHGFELITKIREKNERLPVIVCSAYQGMKENADLHFHDVTAFFFFFLNMDILKEKIQFILSGSTRKNEIQSR